MLVVEVRYLRAIDGVDEESDKLHDVVKDLDKMDVLLPQLLEQFPPIIATHGTHADA